MEKLLQQLGLGNKEQVIYKLILKHGRIAPALLARLAQINRTTVYSVAQELKSKGLIIEDLGGKTMYYIPARENELEKVIEKEHENTKAKEAAIRELQEVIKTTAESTNYSVPKMRFIDEADLEKYLFEATPRWIESGLINDPTWWGFQDHTFVEQHEKWILWFWKNAPEQINLKLFSNQSESEERIGEHGIDRRQIRFWEQNNHFTGTQWIVGAYIILIVTSSHPHYLVEIHDAVLAHNMREVFKHLWKNK